MASRRTHSRKSRRSKRNGRRRSVRRVQRGGKNVEDACNRLSHRIKSIDDKIKAIDDMKDGWRKSAAKYTLLKLHNFRKSYLEMRRARACKDAKMPLVGPSSPVQVDPALLARKSARKSKTSTSPEAPLITAPPLLLTAPPLPTMPAPPPQMGFPAVGGSRRKYARRSNRSRSRGGSRRKHTRNTRLNRRRTRRR